VPIAICQLLVPISGISAISGKNVFALSQGLAKCQLLVPISGKKALQSLQGFQDKAKIP